MKIKDDELSIEDFLDTKGIKDLEDLVSQFRLMIIGSQEKKNGIMASGKNINGVLGIGSQTLQHQANHLNLLSIPELSNRKVLSVTCGDFHTLAVVSGYLPSAKIKGILDKSNYFDGSDVFGWGENGCG